MAINFNGQTSSSLSYIEEVTLGIDEEIYEVTRRSSGMDLDGIGVVGDIVGEGQVTGGIWARFCSGSVAELDERIG